MLEDAAIAAHDRRIMRSHLSTAGLSPDLGNSLVQRRHAPQVEGRELAPAGVGGQVAARSQRP